MVKHDGEVETLGQLVASLGKEPLETNYSIQELEKRIAELEKRVSEQDTDSNIQKIEKRIAEPQNQAAMTQDKE